MGGPQLSILGGEHTCPGLGWQLSSLSLSGAVARAVPRPARQHQVSVQLCRGAGAGGQEDLVCDVRGGTIPWSPSAGVGAACACLPFKSQVLKYPQQLGTVPGRIWGL